MTTLQFDATNDQPVYHTAAEALADKDEYDPICGLCGTQLSSPFIGIHDDAGKFMNVCVQCLKYVLYIRTRPNYFFN
jgi:hypothetical protein